MKDKNYTILFEKYLRNEASADEVAQLQAIMHHDAKIQAIFEDELRYSDSSMDENTRHKLFQNIRRQVYNEKEPRFLQKSWKKRYTGLRFSFYPLSHHFPYTIIYSKAADR